MHGKSRRRNYTRAPKTVTEMGTIFVAYAMPLEWCKFYDRLEEQFHLHIPGYCVELPSRAHTTIKSRSVIEVNLLEPSREHIIRLINSGKLQCVKVEIKSVRYFPQLINSKFRMYLVIEGTEIQV